MTKIITKDNYDELVMNNGKTVLLDFWATWCGPCQSQAPVLEQFSEENPDIFVGKINVDSEPELTLQYKVMTIPTLVVIKDGERKASKAGFSTKEEIKKLVEG